MNLTKCLLITLLGVALLLAVSFLSLYLAKKSAGDAQDEPVSDKIEESKSKLAKIEQDLQKNKKEMMDQLREEQQQYIKESSERFKVDVEQFKNLFPDLKPVPQLPPSVDIDLLLDVNLPDEGNISVYLSGGQRINVTRQDSGNVAKFSHQRPDGGTFNLSQVRFGGNTYPLPKVNNVFILTALALVHDPGFPYYVIVSASGNKVTIFENDGNQFIEIDDVESFEESMKQKATQFGRPTSGSPPRSRYTPDSSPLQSNESVQSRVSVTPPIEFNLTANAAFKVGDFDFEVESADQFQNYTKYFYMDSDQPFKPKSFTADGTEQIGLPLDQFLHSVVVYMLKGTKTPPLVVKVNNGIKERYYRNNLNNTWVPMDSDHLEENLNYADSLLHDKIVLNLGRRSDYFRNGTGSSNVEATKDVNVYVEVNKPVQDWSTFIHTLEVGGEGGDERNFNVSKIMFGNNSSDVKPSKLCKQVHVYSKSDSANAVPTVFLAKYADETHEYFVFDGTKYESRSDLNEDDLVNTLTKPTSSQ